jgi:hypothetical protein
MKKQVTKILLTAVLFSMIGQNFAYAEIANQRNSIWQLAKTNIQKIGTVGDEIVSRAGSRLFCLTKSAFSGGNKLLSVFAKGLASHSQRFEGINNRHIAAGAAVIAVAGGIAYYLLVNPKYEELYNAIRNQCSAADDEEGARCVFENSSAKNYLPQWYYPQTKARYIKGFVKYCDGKDANVLSVASKYYQYITRPWASKKELIKISIGAATAIALTFKPEKKSTKTTASLDFYQDPCYLG